MKLLGSRKVEAKTVPPLFARTPSKVCGGCDGKGNVAWLVECPDCSGTGRTT